MKIILGIDIAKKKLDVSLLINNKSKHKTYKNNAEGFAWLSVWLKKYEDY
jgi:hypothetical protein